jgi:urease gamma subunit
VVADVSGLDAWRDRLCATLSLNAPRAVALCKELIAGVCARRSSPADLMDFTETVLSQVRAGQEVVEGTQALLSRRKPSWATTPLEFDRTALRASL